jgi:hypothetical protein
MGQRFEWSPVCAIAQLMALLAGLGVTAAKAGDGAPSEKLGSGLHEQTCGAPGEPCARISGYIKAGSDSFARDPDGQRPRGISPFPAGIGGMGQSAADTLTRGVFLEVSHDQQVR